MSDKEDISRPSTKTPRTPPRQTPPPQPPTPQRTPQPQQAPGTPQPSTSDLRTTFYGTEDHGVIRQTPEAKAETIARRLNPIIIDNMEEQVQAAHGRVSDDPQATEQQKASYTKVYDEAPERVQNAMRTIRTRKGWFTQYLSGIERTLNLFPVLERMPTSAINKLHELKPKLDRQLQEIEILYGVCADGCEQYHHWFRDQDAALKQRYDAVIFGDAHTRFERYIQEARERQEDRRIPREANVVQNKKKLPLSDIKPNVLEKNVTLANFLQWKSRFRSYYELTELMNESRETQLIFFKSYVKPELYMLIEARIGTLPLYFREDDDSETNSVMKLLTSEINRQNPLLNERIKLFQKRQSGDSAIAFVAQVRQEALVANIAGMNTDDVLSFLILKGLKDKDLLLLLLNE